MKAGIGRKISKGPSQKDTSPLITYWIYGSLQPTHRYYHHKTVTFYMLFLTKTRKYLQNTQKGKLIACLWEQRYTFNFLSSYHVQMHFVGKKMTIKEIIYIS